MSALIVKADMPPKALACQLVTQCRHNRLTGSLPLRHPGQAHALIEALAPCEVRRMVAHGEGAEAADVEVRIERKSCLYGGPRLVQRAETHQRSRKTEMHNGVVPVCVEGPVQPDDSFGIKV